VTALPVRGNYLVKDAYVVTMDPVLGDIPKGSVHVRNGQIVAVGAEVIAPGAEVLDGRGMIVLPGLIDTHYHMWQTLFRNFGGVTPQTVFFVALHQFAAGMEPQDMYAASLLASAEALNAGVTTVHDWCHNIRTRAHADQDVRGLHDVGIRARWSFGQWEDQAVNETMRLDDLVAMHRDWKSYANDGLIHMGMAWRGMFRKEWIPQAVYQKEYDTAHGLGLPITSHIGTLTESVGHIERHYKAGFLSKDMNIVHACSASPEEVLMVKETGATVSSLPVTEMLGAWGFPKLDKFLAAGVPTGLGIDSDVLGGGTSMFKTMQFAMAACNTARHEELALTPRRALALGTIEAARVLGIDDQVGSLKPGKRGDLIMMRTDGLGVGIWSEAAATVIGSGTPEYVDTVMVDGRVLKRHGKLTAINVEQVVAGARASRQSVQKRLKLG
jgi:5-methylthioadenosine/S-adenosylhomocysteine deaminase